MTNSVQQEIESFERARREYRRQRDLERSESPQDTDPITRYLGDLGDEEKAIIRLLVERISAGQKRYGKINIKADKRDFITETVEETLDALFYISAALIRLQSNQDKE